jgi:hypothetical protein
MRRSPNHRNPITNRFYNGGPKRQSSRRTVVWPLSPREPGVTIPGATIVDQPVAMFRRKHVIDVQMFSRKVW